MKIHPMADFIENSGVQFGTSGARGLVSQMTPEVCYAYASAFWQVAGVGSRVVVGHDLRPSSPDIASACACAFADMGVDIYYAGALPTPALAFYAAQMGAPAIVVTGSHIPFDRNGIKFYRAEGEITKADEQAMLQMTVTLPEALAPTPLPLPDLAAQDAYVQRYVKFFGAASLTGKRVAVYEHSSVARDVLRTILEALGAEVLSLGRTETFVPIDTEAVRVEDVTKAISWANEHGFDAVLSTDGDADRPLIGDEKGHWFRGDIVGILCAQFLAADVVVTPVSSNTALEKCGLFKQVVRTKIGSPYVIEGMAKSALATQLPSSKFSNSDLVIVGFEANGGFLLGSDVLRQGQCLTALPTRDALLPMLALLCMSMEKGCKLSELCNDLPKRFTHSDRVQNFPTEMSRALVTRLKQAPQDAQALMAPDAGDVLSIDTTDGLRVTFSSGDVVHLRPSGNAPELRCYAEAETPERAQYLCSNCLNRVVIFASAGQ